MKSKQTHARRKKTAVRARSTRQRSDLFTALCRSRLGVECVREHRFHPSRMWRFDYAIPERRIALEVEGGVWTQGRHTRPRGFLGDMEKYNAAAVLGWRVVRTTPDRLFSAATLDMLGSMIETGPAEHAGLETQSRREESPDG